MSVTEYERTRLFNWFEEHMGKERAATMMSLLPPVGWADVATTRDLEALAERFEARFERLDTKIDHVAERLDAKIDAKVEGLRADLQRTFVTWILTAQATTIAAVGLMLALTR